MWASALCARQVVKPGDREPVQERSAPRHGVLRIVAEPRSRTLDAVTRIVGRHGEPRGELVRKLSEGAAKPQVTAWASSFCKSVGVCLRRFESCTCH
jgi:hypothetical protein